MCGAGKYGGCPQFLRLLGWDLRRATQPVQKLTQAELKRGVTACDRLLTRANEASPAGPDGDLVLEEFRHAAGLTRYAANRGLLGLGGKVDAVGLRGELLSLVAEHERLWLQRNRPGGLHESSAGLRAGLEALGPCQD